MKILGHKEKQHKGFTLVEVIVTCVILAILLAAGVGAIVKYRHLAMYKQNNEYARTIFAASQSALSYYKAGGQLEELAEEADGNQVTAAGVEHPEQLRYLLLERNESSREDNRLYQLLKDYVYDESIFRASVRVEFNPETGAVYAVCYSDRTDTFTDELLSAVHTGTAFGVGGREDWDALRQQYILGYYDSRQAGAAVDTSEKVSVKKVWWENGETLELIWDIQGKRDVSQYDYRVDIYQDADQTDPSCILMFDGKTLGNASTLWGNSGNQVTCKARIGNEEEKELKFRIYKKGTEVHMMMDAVDLEAASIAQENSVSQLPAAYDRTYSIRRLGLDLGKKIGKAQVTVFGENIQTGAQNTNITQEEEEPLMAFDSDGAKQEYVLENARHLFNIRFVEGAGNGGNTYRPAKQEESQDPLVISWSGEDGIVGRQLVFRRMGGTQQPAFPAITSLKKNSVLDGNKMTLQSFAFAAPENDSPLQQEADAVGLFGSNAGTVRNLTLKDAVLSSYSVKFAGFVCGSNTGTIKGVVVDNDRKTDNVIRAEFLGGITGSSENPGTVIKCVVSAALDNRKEESYQKVGGIAGYDEGGMEACRFTGRLTAGSTKDGESSSIGGLVGHAKGTYKNLYNDSRSSTIIIRAENGNVGGLFGQLEGSLIGALNASGSLAVDIQTGGKSCMGGVAGHLTGFMQDVNINGLNETVSLRSDGDGTIAGGLAGRVTGTVLDVVDEVAGGYIRTARLENCRTGEDWSVTATGTDGVIVGGMAGQLDGNMECDMRKLRNRTKIQAAASTVIGGIAGVYAGDAEWYAQGVFENCINVSDLPSDSLGKPHAGILGYVSSGRLKLSYCRNYGRPSDVSDGNYEKAELSGILGGKSESVESIRITGCYGVADMRYPITRYKASDYGMETDGSSPETQNYYFVPKGEDEAELGEELDQFTFQAFDVRPYAPNGAMRLQDHFNWGWEDLPVYVPDYLGTNMQAVFLLAGGNHGWNTLDGLKIDWMGTDRTYYYDITVDDMRGNTETLVTNQRVDVKSATGHMETTVRLPKTVTDRCYVILDIRMEGKDDIKYAGTNLGSSAGIWEVWGYQPSQNGGGSSVPTGESRDGLGQPLIIHQDESTGRYEGRYQEGSDLMRRAIGMEADPHSGDLSGYELSLKVDPYLYTDAEKYKFPDDWKALPETDPENPEDPDVPEEPDVPKEDEEPLETPEIRNLDLEADAQALSPKAEEPYTASEFEQLIFRYQVQSGDQEAGNYEMQLGLYDSGLQPDGTPDPAQLCDQTALQTVKMTGNNFALGDYETGYLSDYGEKYVIVRIRRTTDKKVSEWSGYAQFQLPKIGLDVPRLSEDTYEEDTVFADKADEIPAEKMKLYRHVLQWEALDEAERYEVELGDLEYLSLGGSLDYMKGNNQLSLRKVMNKNEASYVVRLPIYHERLKMIEYAEYVLQPVEGKNGLYELALSDAALGLGDSAAGDENKQWHVYNYVSGRKFAATDGSGYAYSFDVDLKVQVQEENGRSYFRLVLPDLTDEYGNQYFMTGSVTVSAVPAETGEPHRYASRRVQWVRTFSSSQWEADGSLLIRNWIRELGNAEKIITPVENQPDWLIWAQKGIPWVSGSNPAAPVSESEVSGEASGTRPADPEENNGSENGGAGTNTPSPPADQEKPSSTPPEETTEIPSENTPTPETVPENTPGTTPEKDHTPSPEGTAEPSPSAGGAGEEGNDPGNDQPVTQSEGGGGAGID